MIDPAINDVVVRVSNLTTEYGAKKTDEGMYDISDIEFLLRLVKNQTPSAAWWELGRDDPHGTSYSEERFKLTLGHYSDDEIANGVFMLGDQPSSLSDILAGKPGKIAWLTAAKERIRWLSRSLVDAQEKLAKLTDTRVVQNVSIGTIKVTDSLKIFDDIFVGDRKTINIKSFYDNKSSHHILKDIVRYGNLRGECRLIPNEIHALIDIDESSLNDSDTIKLDKYFVSPEFDGILSRWLEGNIRLAGERNNNYTKRQYILLRSYIYKLIKLRYHSIAESTASEPLRTPNVTAPSVHVNKISDEVTEVRLEGQCPDSVVMVTTTFENK